MPNLQNGSKEGFEPGLTSLRTCTLTVCDVMLSKLAIATSNLGVLPGSLAGAATYSIHRPDHPLIGNSGVNTCSRNSTWRVDGNKRVSSSSTTVTLRGREQSVNRQYSSDTIKAVIHTSA